MNGLLNISKNSLALVVVASLSLLYAFVVSSRTNVTRASSDKGAFLLAVVAKFKSVEDKAAFKALIHPYTEYIRLNEPKTLSYVVYESDKDPNQVMIFERYVDKDAYLNIHKRSPQFLMFREKLQDMVKAELVVLDGHSYIESSTGFV